MVDKRSSTPTGFGIEFDTYPMSTSDIPALVDAIPQPVWIARLDGSIEYVNPYWRSFTGLTEEAALGHGWTDAVHPEDLETISTAALTASETGKAFDIEYRMRRADSVYRWHLTRVAPFLKTDSPGSEDIAWVGIGFDIHDRRLAEEASRLSEAQYRDIVDHASDIVYTLRLDGELAAVNPAIERLLGYRPDELIGRSIDRVIAPYDRDRAREMARQRASDTSQFTYEIDLVAKDGRHVPVEINSRSVVSTGLPVLIHGIARDISARRERTQQANLMAAVGTALTSTDALDEQLGYCAEALVSHLDAALARIWTIDENDPNLLVLHASAGLYTHRDGAHGRIPVGQWKIGRIARERRPYLTNTVIGDPGIHDQEWARHEGMVAFAGYPLLVGDRMLGVMALFARHPLDETTWSALTTVTNALAVGIDRHRAETARESLLLAERSARKAAEDAETRYRGLFEGVADAILVAGADRYYHDTNAAASALLGYSRAELIQLRTDDIVAYEPAWTRDEFDRFRTEGRWQGELELRRKDGSQVPVEARATVVSLPGGPVFISVIRDISERKHLERLQRDFLAMVTHDLRSPLTAVKGWTQVLQRRAGIDERSRQTVSRILIQVEQMNRLIGDLAELVRIEAGELQLKRDPCNLVELAREQVALAESQTAGHSMRIESGVDPLMAMVDRQRIGQVLQNLLVNAVKYSPDGGDISLRLEIVDDEVRINVVDRGIGIAPDQMGQLFERFYRADFTGAGGLGLGLHISKMLVDAHGGRITVRSTQGQGSTFTVALPLVSPDDLAL